jgi:NAD+ kinase
VPRAKRPRVLVIYKKSAYQIYVRERRHAQMRSLLRRREPVVARMLEADREHQETVAQTRNCLKALGAEAMFRYRADAAVERGVDLIVTVGGDGTLLWAAHRVGASCPVLAVNSAPGDSVGFFCSANRESLEDALADALHGKSRATELTRMSVSVDGELVGPRVLNDVLFTHVVPAATTRYTLTHKGARATHKSSGLWVSTAAGSTAAIYSAGGKPQPISSERLQFRVREPYVFDRKVKLTSGFIGPREVLNVESHIRVGRLYFDGPRRVHPVTIGAQIEIARSPEPLTLLGKFRRL